jgi:hypothetical protein
LRRDGTVTFSLERHVLPDAVSSQPDDALATRLAFEAKVGHACGSTIMRRSTFSRHPEFACQKPLARDLASGPWTLFEAGH